MNVADLFL